MSSFISKSCSTRVKSAPSERSARILAEARTSNSLPNGQAPMRLPSQSDTSVMPLSAHATDRVADRWKTCARWTRSEPASRASSTFGTQAMVNSGRPEPIPPPGNDRPAAGEDFHLR